MIAFARFEIRRNLRDTRFLLFLVAMPTMLYLMLSGFSSSGSVGGLRAPVAFMVAMMCYAAIGSACYAIGPPLAQERATRWARQLQIMPLRGTHWLMVKLIQGALLTIPGVAAVAVAAAVVHSPGLNAAEWSEVALVLLVGSLPFTVVGLVIGQSLEGQAANSATLFIVLGLSFAGGLLIPDSQLPSAVRQVAVALPSRQLADLARGAAVGHPPSILGIAILAAWALAASAGAVVLRRRDAAA
ncbi:MAG: ABC transporter permease [Acidimicrobiales bacterium]